MGIVLSEAKTDTENARIATTKTVAEVLIRVMGPRPLQLIILQI
jgi:hypothetical protein